LHKNCIRSQKDSSRIHGQSYNMSDQTCSGTILNEALETSYHGCEEKQAVLSTMEWH